MPLPISLTASRRQTLGLAVLSMAGLQHAATVEGKNKKHRKKNDTCDRKVERAVADRCGQQVDFCLANVLPICERETRVTDCPAAVRQCCDLFGQCDPAGYFACIEENFGPPDNP